jgi:hypothetical protein
MNTLFDYKCLFWSFFLFALMNLGVLLFSIHEKIKISGFFIFTIFSLLMCICVVLFALWKIRTYPKK